MADILLRQAHEIIRCVVNAGDYDDTTEAVELLERIDAFLEPPVASKVPDPKDPIELAKGLAQLLEDLEADPDNTQPTLAAYRAARQGPEIEI